jgi:translocation and assembly module TamB
VEFDRDGDALELITTIEQENQRIAQVGTVLVTHLTEVLHDMLRDGKEVDMSNPDNWLDSFDVKLALQRADLGRLIRMGEVMHPVEGIMGGGIRLSGTMDEPKLQGGLVLANGRVGEARLKQFTFGLMPEGDGYTIESIMDFFDEGGFELNGTIPLVLRFDEEPDLTRPGLEIQIKGDGIPLAMAAGPTGLAEASGTIVLEGEVTGTLDAPVPRLAVGANDAGFTLLATALRYDPIKLDITYEPDKLVINNVSIRSNQLWGQNPKSGKLVVSGQVGLDDEGPTDISISTKMKQFWLSANRQASVATSGKITVAGPFPNLKIKGGIKMDEATISVGEEILKDTSGFEVDDTIQIHRAKREVVLVRREEEEEESISDNFSIDLKVDLDQKVRLKADVPLSEDFGSQFSQLATFNLDIGLDGVLDIGQEKGVMSVVGELATMRGEMVALGKRFSLTEGDITFTGENYTNPQLNILASHQVGQYGSVDIAIAGDVENTGMELSSPEYPDQTDVMSMLLFGKPTSAMSETEGESGAGLLSAAMASVGGQAARATGAAFLQNVQIDPGSGSVKVGFPLTDKIYLSIERVTPEEDTDNVTQAALEWILSRQTYGELITGDRGQSSGDLYWRWRF